MHSICHLKDIISALGDIGSFLAALVGLGTLFLLKKQNSNAYEADLGLASGVEYLKFKEGKAMKDDNSLFAKDWIEPISLKIFNCGFGSAKNVKITYSYDFEKSLDFVKSIINTLGLEKIFEIEINTNSYLLKQNGNNIESLNIVNNHFEWNINFIQPHKQFSESSNLPLPNQISFFLFCVSHIHKHYGDSFIYYISQGEFKPLTFKVKISYDCVTGKSTSQKYEVESYFFVDTEGPKVKFISKLIK